MTIQDIVRTMDNVEIEYTKSCTQGIKVAHEHTTVAPTKVEQDTKVELVVYEGYESRNKNKNIYCLQNILTYYTIDHLINGKLKPLDWQHFSPFGQVEILN